MAPESIKTCLDIFSSWTPRPQSWNISYFSYFFFPNKSLLAKRSLDQLFWGERFFSSPIISIHIHHLDSNTFYFVNLRLHYSAIMAFGNFFFLRFFIRHVVNVYGLTNFKLFESFSVIQKPKKIFSSSNLLFRISNFACVLFYDFRCMEKLQRVMTRKF